MLVLTVSWDTVRLFLHVLAATVWVGGQLTLAALVPVLRRLGPDVPRAAARRFNLVAWPAYAVLVLTGAWNIAAAADPMTTSYRATLIAKLAVVAASGITAVLHARAKSTARLAIWGAVTGLTALGALFLGVLLAG
jgi:putative copper export protein